MHQHEDSITHCDIDGRMSVCLMRRLILTKIFHTALGCICKVYVRETRFHLQAVCLCVHICWRCASGGTATSVIFVNMSLIPSARLSLSLHPEMSTSSSLFLLLLPSPVTFYSLQHFNVFHKSQSLFSFVLPLFHVCPAIHSVPSLTQLGMGRYTAEL